MKLFVGNKEKIVYIMAPKCGTTTIASHLNTNFVECIKCFIFNLPLC